MRILKAFFGREGRRSIAPSTSPARVQQASLESYVARALDVTRDFTDEGKVLLLQHLRQRESRLASLPPGSKESREAFKAEEQALEALAARILAPGYTGTKHINGLFADVYYSATFSLKRDRDLAKARAAGVQKMALMNAHTGDECAWCVESEGAVFSTGDDINAILAAQCTCVPYPKAVFNPVIEGFDD